MPEICRFYGIIIRIFSIDREHPPKHIHSKYNDYEAVMEIGGDEYHPWKLAEKSAGFGSGVGWTSSTGTD